MANPAPERCQTQSHKTSVSPNPELLLQKICVQSQAAALLRHRKNPKAGARGGRVPQSRHPPDRGALEQGGGCVLSRWGCGHPILLGCAGPSLPVSLGRSPPHPHGEELRPGGRQQHWGEAVRVLGFTPAGTFLALSCPSTLAPTCRSVPSRAVPRHPTLSCAHSSPAKIISCQFPTQVPLPPPLPAPLGAQAGQDFCGNPQGLTITPAAKGPGNSCHGFLLRSRDRLCFLGEHKGLALHLGGTQCCLWGRAGVVFAFGDTRDGIAFGEDAGDGFTLGGHRGWRCF